MSKKSSFAGDTKIALVLAAILAGAGQPAGTPPAQMLQPAVRANLSPPMSGTRGQAPAGSQSQQQVAEAKGGRGKGRQQAEANRLRRARRWMERQGFPRSGRYWSRFRTMARVGGKAAVVLAVALEKGNA